MADAVPLFTFDNQILTPVSNEVLLRQNSKGQWKVVENQSSKTKIYVTAFQMFVILLVILTCIVNISLENGNSEMWVSFMGLAFGAVLPGPKAKTLANSMLKSSPSTVIGQSSNDSNATSDNSSNAESNALDIDTSV